MIMNQYPNQGQDPNQPPQAGQYGNTGQEQTQYSPPPGSGEHGTGQQGAGYASQQGFPQPGQQPYQPDQYQQQQYQSGQQPYQQQYQQGPQYQQPYQQQGQQQYQQPYGQAPYMQSSPYPQAPAISFDYRNIIAGVGAFFAIIAFFLPYYNGPARNPITYDIIYFSASGASLGAQLWLDFIVALLAFAIVGALQFQDQLFKTSTNPTLQRLYTSLQSQPKNWYMALIGLGSFGIFFRFILDLGKIGLWQAGPWIYLLSMIAIVVAGILYIRPPVAAPAPAPTPTQTPPLS